MCEKANFLRATAYNAIVRICYRPSVRLSHGGIIEKRLKLGVLGMKFSPYGTPIPLVFAG